LHLALKSFDPPLLSRGTGPLMRCELCLQCPPAQRLCADSDLRTERLAGRVRRRVLMKMHEHHLHGALKLLVRVIIVHGPHPPQGRKWRETQGASVKAEFRSGRQE